MTLGLWRRHRMPSRDGEPHMLHPSFSGIQSSEGSEFQIALRCPQKSSAPPTGGIVRERSSELSRMRLQRHTESTQDEDVLRFQRPCQVMTPEPVHEFPELCLAHEPSAAELVVVPASEVTKKSDLSHSGSGSFRSSHAEPTMLGRTRGCGLRRWKSSTHRPKTLPRQHPIGLPCRLLSRPHLRGPAEPVPSALCASHEVPSVEHHTRANQTASFPRISQRGKASLRLRDSKKDSPAPPRTVDS